LMFVSSSILNVLYTAALPGLHLSLVFSFQQVRIVCTKDQYNFIESFCHSCELANETIG